MNLSNVAQELSFIKLTFGADEGLFNSIVLEQDNCDQFGFGGEKSSLVEQSQLKVNNDAPLFDQESVFDLPSSQCQRNVEDYEYFQGKLLAIINICHYFAKVVILH